MFRIRNDKKIYLILIFGLVAGISKSQNLIEVNRKWMNEYGVTKSNPPYLSVRHYATLVSIDQKTQQTKWVQHVLMPEGINGNVSRSDDFRPDPLYDGSAYAEDYYKSGFDRGHLAPAADFKWSETAMSESFYFTNMTPQVPSFNRGKWADLEDLIRTYAEETGHHVCVITGPLFLKNPPQKIGRNVWIPDACFKAVFDTEAPVPVAAAFIMPNQKGCLSPGMYAVTVDSLEKLTGADFFSGISSARQQEAESVYIDSVWMKGRWKGTTSALSVTSLPTGYFNTLQALGTDAVRLNVCGKVVDWSTNEKSGEIIFSLDQKLNSPVCTILFTDEFKRKTPGFQPKVFEDKNVCVKGEVISYKGRPQIRPDSLSDFKEMEKLRK
jgi:endonuclease G